MGKEPERLREGKRFHRLVQEEWLETAEGEVRPEKRVVKPGGRGGRVDILVDPAEEMVAVVEIKASDWDRMTEANVKRNVRRQARQIWAYIESQLQDGKEVCPGVVFPRKPRLPGRLAQIETLFDAEGIPVVWQDESIEEVGERRKGDGKREAEDE